MNTFVYPGKSGEGSRAARKAYSPEPDWISYTIKNRSKEFGEFKNC